MYIEKKKNVCLNNIALRGEHISNTRSKSISDTYATLFFYIRLLVVCLFFFLIHESFTWLGKNGDNLHAPRITHIIIIIIFFFIRTKHCYDDNYYYYYHYHYRCCTVGLHDDFRAWFTTTKR